MEVTEIETVHESEIQETTNPPSIPPTRKERNFPFLNLTDQTTLNTSTQPVLIVQSPKTPTLSRKLKAVSLDSEPQQQGNTLEVSRDVFSMPNTPKKQIKQKHSCDFDDGAPKSTLAPSFNSNLKKFASNNSISGSQTLKTLPEVNALQDFSDCPNPEPPKVRTKGLLERRGSNASLTIDLGSTLNIAEVKPVPFNRLNTAKSVSNLYLSSMSSEKCICAKKCGEAIKNSTERRKSQEACGDCTIYESEPKVHSGKPRCQNLKRCHGCAKSRRKSLSNENLYVPPCGFCEGESKESSEMRNCRSSNRKAVFPRQPDLDSSQLLSDDFKMHIQNVQYLQTAGKPMTVEDLRQFCEAGRVRKLQQEFWEVPLNLQEKCYVSGSQSKNRYRGVWPNEHSRVRLPSSGGYIHANYIKGPDYTETAYIATQGPLSHTCTDFWEMVWHTQCKCIVMLTGLVEKGRNKCELYFPLGKKTDTAEKTFFYVKTPKVRDKFTFDSHLNSNSYDIETYEFEEKNEVTFGKYKITYVGQRNIDDCQIRRLELIKTDMNVEARTINHYWLSNWPDHKKTNAAQVLKMAIDVLRLLDSSKDDISGEFLNAVTKPGGELPQIDLRNVEPGGSHPRTQTTSESTNRIGNNSRRKDNGSQKTFNFCMDNSETCINIDSQNSQTVTFNFTSATQYSETVYQSITTSESCLAQIRQKECEASTSQSKSREGSISDFNKEVLTNRCSLDSKLQHLNKMSDFKNNFKRDVGPLKAKPSSSERKKSAENIRLPIVCHCSAGIGRTGCFLAILNGIQQLRSNSNVDILAILCSLRLNRGGMVQTAEQYELIHRVLSLYNESI
ncbi:receptor-type tyrosine-protein phosphatase S-like [Euwallacea fornicatus]|uniref:receptor-type tyrosine-protein phosphatase S-like n=1 Tax=Euwallacea fornicatus TaxID=995702 RepID=UPI00338F8755